MYGIITSDGLFEGVIRTPSTVYRIEASHRYNHLDHDKVHSIIYRDHDIEYHKIKGNSKCESDNLHKKMSMMHKMDSKTASDHLNENEKDGKSDTLHYSSDEGKSKYHNQHHHHHQPHHHQHKRVKRAVDKAKTQCSLYVQIGHKYYDYWKTAEAITQQIAQHVQAVNDIYKLIGTKPSSGQSSVFKSFS